MFIRDGVVFHQIYKGEAKDQQMYQKISDTLTLLAQGGERR
jgi:putative ABC transport system ATP-binding protein